MEDEWEREIESDQDLDLLFVEYEKQLITVAQLMKTIQDHKFQVEVKDEG